VSKKKGAKQVRLEEEALQKISSALKLLEQRFENTDLHEWAASTFDPNMVNAL
jgi:hypothetical protein